MSDRMIRISVEEIKDSDVVGMDMPITTPLASGVVPPKIAAGMLRAIADDFDPPRPVMRGRGGE